MYQFALKYNLESVIVPIVMDLPDILNQTLHYSAIGSSPFVEKIVLL